MSDSTKPAGAIYDLGYKRYLGTRRPVSTRWRVIMRQQIAMAWKKWWRFKMPLAGAVVTMFITGGLIYGGNVLRGFGLSQSNIILTYVDAGLPLAMRFFWMSAFMLTLTLGSTIVATDTQSGAFTFYYVRSIRPVDYVLGKLAGFGLLVASIVLVPPFLLALFRLGMSDDIDDAIAHLNIIPETLAIGLLATLAYTAVPLALSSLVGNRRYALALWAAYYVIVGNIAFGLSFGVSKYFAVIDIPTVLQTLTFELFDLPSIMRRGFGRLSFETALIGLLVQAGLAIVILWYQVSRDQKTGVGGSS